MKQKTFASSIDFDKSTITELKKKFGSGTPRYTFSKEIKVKESFVDYLDKSHRSKSRDLRNTPGPGKYEPNTILVRRNPSQWRYSIKSNNFKNFLYII